jgi:hypothetical protein
MTTIPYIVLESKGELGIRRSQTYLCAWRNPRSYCPVLTLDTVLGNWLLALLGSLCPSGEPNVNSHSRFPGCREKDLLHIGDRAHI